MEEVSTTAEPSEAMDNSDKEPVFYVYIALSLLGLVGNVFVCAVMLRYPKSFNSSTNKLIVHQSVVDITAALVFLLRRILFVPSGVPGGIPGSLYCRLWWSEWPQYGMFVTSTYNLAAISMERYLACCQSVKHRNMFSSRRLKCVMAAAWLCGWVPEIHLVAISYQTGDACDMSWPSSTVQAVGGVGIFLWELVIPLFVMIFAYCMIIVELHRRSKARAGTNKEAHNMLSRANKNVTKTLFVVTIFFAVCWIPTDINYILFNLGLNANFTDSIAYQATGAIVVVNLCINPFIYCFTYDRFQKRAKMMILGGCGRRSNQVGTADESMATELTTSARRVPTVQTVA